jgi:hypothetical protein
MAPLIQIKATPTQIKPSPSDKRRCAMPQGEMVYLAGSVIAFIVFAITVFWAERQTHDLKRD